MNAVPQPDNILPFFTGRTVARAVDTYAAPSEVLPASKGTCVMFDLPFSEIESFHAYVSRIRWEPWEPCAELAAIEAMTPRDAKDLESQPFNQLTPAGPSRKGLLRDIQRLMKKEQLGVQGIRIPPQLWIRVVAAAQHYGISEADHCRLSLGYYAALGRKTAVRSRIGGVA